MDVARPHLQIKLNIIKVRDNLGWSILTILSHYVCCVWEWIDGLFPDSGGHETYTYRGVLSAFQLSKGSILDY